ASGTAWPVAARLPGGLASPRSFALAAGGAGREFYAVEPGGAPQIGQPLAPGPGALVVAGQPGLGHLAGRLIDARPQFLSETCHDASLARAGDVAPARPRDLAELLFLQLTNLATLATWNRGPAKACSFSAWSRITWHPRPRARPAAQPCTPSVLLLRSSGARTGPVS